MCKVEVGLALGSGDLRLAHGSSRDTKHVERVEGCRSGSRWLDGVIVVLSAKAEDVVLTRQHGSGDCS